jgi:hypothetical protein
MSTFIQQRFDMPQTEQSKTNTDDITPLFYLTTEPINDYERDVYFVNNTDTTLDFVAPFKLYHSIMETAGFLNTNSCPKIYDREIDRLYTKVLPKQALKIDRLHIIYDSDETVQYFINLPYVNADNKYSIWQFMVLAKGGIGGSYTLLNSDFSHHKYLPTTVISEMADMPIVPTLYDERCGLLDKYYAEYKTHIAELMLAINDVLYQRAVGVGLGYSETSIEATEIVQKLQATDINDANAVLDITRKVYGKWFSEDIAKRVEMEDAEALYKVYSWYQKHGQNLS